MHFVTLMVYLETIAAILGFQHQVFQQWRIVGLQPSLNNAGHMILPVSPQFCIYSPT